jgi:hypothetical protein
MMFNEFHCSLFVVRSCMPECFVYNPNLPHGVLMPSKYAQRWITSAIGYKYWEFFRAVGVPLLTDRSY